MPLVPSIFVLLILAASRSDKQARVSARTSLESACLSDHSFELFPELELIFGQVLDLQRYVSDASNNLFEEYL